MSTSDLHRIWERSRSLSHAYWAQYNLLIGQNSTTRTTSSTCEILQPREPDSDSNESLDEEIGTDSELDIAIDIDLQSAESESEEEEKEKEELSAEEEEINPQYLEFIKITRRHQQERDRLKQLEKKKRPDLLVEEYYKDISQVDTLVEENLVEAPTKDDANHLSSAKIQEDKLIKLYGSREAYDKIRSMEMSIDEYFNKKIQELNPQYWPVMPLNPKPYLNPIK